MRKFLVAAGVLSPLVAHLNQIVQSSEDHPEDTSQYDLLEQILKVLITLSLTGNIKEKTIPYYYYHMRLYIYYIPL